MQFLRQVAVVGQAFEQGTGTSPGELFRQAAVGEAQVPQAEGGEGVVFELESVVPGLLQARHISPTIRLQGLDACERVSQVAHDQWFVLPR